MKVNLLLIATNNKQACVRQFLQRSTVKTTTVVHSRLAQNMKWQAKIRELILMIPVSSSSSSPLWPCLAVLPSSGLVDNAEISLVHNEPA